MRIVLTTIPIPIENPTSPSRYSFLRGLKKVRKRSGKENQWRSALLREAKNVSILTGASTNQNVKKAKGSVR